MHMPLGGHLFIQCLTWTEFCSQLFSPINQIDPEIVYETNTYRYQDLEGSLEVSFVVHWIGPRTMHRIGRDGINNWCSWCEIRGYCSYNRLKEACKTILTNKGVYNEGLFSVFYDMVFFH